MYVAGVIGGPHRVLAGTVCSLKEQEISLPVLVCHYSPIAVLVTLMKPYSDNEYLGAVGRLVRVTFGLAVQYLVEHCSV